MTAPIIGSFINAATALTEIASQMFALLIG
jgi:hypothetical protein